MLLVKGFCQYKSELSYGILKFGSVCNLGSRIRFMSHCHQQHSNKTQSQNMFDETLIELHYSLSQPEYQRCIEYGQEIIAILPLNWMTKTSLCCTWDFFHKVSLYSLQLRVCTPANRLPTHKYTTGFSMEWLRWAQKKPQIPKILELASCMTLY